MPVEIYKSTDASAPVLTGEYGKLIDLLDAVLVNGYGAKAAAGWTKPYSDTAGYPWHYTSGGASGTNSTSHTLSSIVSVTGTTIFLAIVTAEATGTATVTTPSGWSQLVNHERFGIDGTDACLNVYYRHIKSSADLTPSGLTLNASTTVYWVSGYATMMNVDFADPYVLSDPGAPQTAGLNQNSPAVTLDEDNDAILVLLANHDSGLSITYPSGFTSSGSGSYATGDISVYWGHRLANAAGSNGPFTWSKSADNSLGSYTLTIGIKGAQGAGGKRAVFRQGAGNLRYLQVLDGSANQYWTNEASVKIAESMSSVIAGSNITPAASGVSIKKSATVDNTARPWVMVADEKRFYLFIQTGDFANSYFSTFIGDFESYIAGDTYNTILISRSSQSGATSAESFGQQHFLGASGSPSQFVLRNYLSTGIGMNIRKFSDVANFVAGLSGSNSSVGSGGSLPFPNPQNGAMYVSETFLHEDHAVQTAANLIRGKIPGLWWTPHVSTNFDDLQVFAGEGELVGRTFLHLKSVYGGSTTGTQSGVMIEISDTWE